MAQTFYTLGFNSQLDDLPDEDVEAQSPYGAIRQYREKYPDSIWISARPIPGHSDDRREWHQQRSE